MTNLTFEALWRDRGAQDGLRRLSREADTAHGKFSLLNSGLGRLGKGFSGAAGLALKFGVAGGAAFAAAGAAAVGFGIKVASSNEQAQIGFTTMLGSATKADKFLRQLQKFAATTPFEFPELQTAASSLISAGINANKVIPIMRNLGNVTSGMGTGAEGVKRATIALQQMNAAGRITGEDLNQLRDAGIPVYDLLAAATGKSKAEVVKLAQAGKLGQKELGLMMKALESGKGLERFAGLMDKQSQSLAGLWSTVKDTFGQGLAKAIQPGIPILKKVLKGIPDAAQPVLDSLAGMLSDAAGWVNTNKGSLGAAFRIAGTTVKGFGRITEGVFKSFAESIGGGKGSFRDFTEYVEEHQTDLVVQFARTADVALLIGNAFGVMGAAVVMITGAVVASVGVLFDSVVTPYKDFVHLFAKSLGAPQWIRDLDKDLQGFSAGGVTKAGQAAMDAAQNFADGLNPAVKDARGELAKLAATELAKAQWRESAAAARDAVDAIGKKGDFARLKLKGFNFEADTGTRGQRAFRSRVNDAREALEGQYRSAKNAGASHKTLNGILKTGRERLRDEFIQMGYTKEEAGRLAAKFTSVAREAKKVPKSVKTKITWDTVVDDINTKLTFAGGKGARLMSANADGGVLPGWSPGRDVHSFYSPTAGHLKLSGGEAIMRPEWTRAVGGPAAVAQMNAAARGGSFASGGVWGAGTDAVLSGGGTALKRLLRQAAAAGSSFGGVGRVGVGHLAQAALARVGDAWDIGTCLRFVRMMAGAPGGTYDASAAWANARYKHRGDRNAPSGVPMYWGGGHGHIAVSIGGGKIVGTDFPRTGRIGLASASRLTSAWGKPYLGWANDVNGVVTSGYGLPAARNGGVFGAGPVHVGEAGPERILTAAQTRTFDRMVRVMSQNGGAVTYVVNISAPNYIGSRQELRQTLVDMTRSGAFEVVKR